MHVRNLNQMFNHKPKLKPRCTPNIRINSNIEKRLTRFDVVCLLYVFHRSTDIYRYREHECVRQVKADAL